MYFLNLSLLQFLAVFGSISVISVALYLLDRSRRKQVVSTLRFWVAAENPVAAARCFATRSPNPQTPRHPAENLGHCLAPLRRAGI